MSTFFYFFLPEIEQHNINRETLEIRHRNKQRHENKPRATVSQMQSQAAQPMARAAAANSDRVDASQAVCAMRQVIEMIITSGPGTARESQKRLLTGYHCKELTPHLAEDAIDPKSRVQYHCSSNPSCQETPPPFLVRNGVVSPLTMIRRSLLYIIQFLKKESKCPEELKYIMFNVLKVAQIFLLATPHQVKCQCPPARCTHIQTMSDFLSSSSVPATPGLLRSYGLEVLIANDFPYDGEGSAGVKVRPSPSRPIHVFVARTRAACN